MNRLIREDKNWHELKKMLVYMSKFESYRVGLTAMVSGENSLRHGTHGSAG